MRRLVFFWGGLFLTVAATAATSPEVKRFLDDIDLVSLQTESWVAAKNKEDPLKDEAFSKLMHWTPAVSFEVDRSQEFDGKKAVHDSYGGRADWNLFHGGQQHYEYKEADANYQAQVEKSKEAGRTAQKAAAQLLFRRITLITQQKVIEKLVQIKKDSRDVIEKMYHLGRLPQQEVTKAEIDLAQTQSRLRSSRIESIENDLQIKDLIGNAITATTWPFKADQAFKPPVNAASDSHLLMLKLENESKEYAYAAAKGAFSPALDLSFSYNKTFGENTQSFGQGPRFGEGPRGFLTLSVPLWTRWQTYSGLSAASAALKTSAFETAQDTQSYLNEREAAAQTLELVRENLKEAELNLDRSKILFTAVEKSFRLGRISVNDMLIEQARLRDVELNYVSQLYGFHSSVVDNCLLFNESLRQCFE